LKAYKVMLLLKVTFFVLNFWVTQNTFLHSAHTYFELDVLDFINFRKPKKINYFILGPIVFIFIQYFYRPLRRKKPFLNAPDNRAAQCFT
jgi:hypothetical protein